MRKSWIVNLTVLFLLLFTYSTFADDSENTAINNAMNFASSKADFAKSKINELELMEKRMTLDIGKWKDNDDAIATRIMWTITAVFVTIAIAFATYMSGVTMGVGTVTAAMLTLIKVMVLAAVIGPHSGFTDAMETSIKAVTEQRKVVEKGIIRYSEIYDDDDTTYNGAYERYLKKLAAHTGWTAKDIDYNVNTYDTDYDQFVHKPSQTPTHKHFGSERRKFGY